MNKEKKISFGLDEQLWKKVKTLQVNSNINSFRDFYVAISLRLANNEISIPESYDVSKELQTFLNLQNNNKGIVTT